MAKYHSSRRSRRSAEKITEGSKRPIPPHWPGAARRKEFSVHSRDPKRREALLLKCTTCGEILSMHRHVKMTAQPVFTPCHDATLAEEAGLAGLKFLHRDADDSHYAIFRAPCGHDVRRQTHLQLPALRAGRIAHPFWSFPS